MSYKIITTTLLVIVASLLLVTLALKVKVESRSTQFARGQAVGCCAKGGGGCASAGENQLKGEVK